MSRGYPLPPCIVAMPRPCPLSPDSRRAASSGDGSGRRGNSGRLESNQQSRRYLARLPLTSLPVVVGSRFRSSECAPCRPASAFCYDCAALVVRLLFTGKHA